MKSKTIWIIVIVVVLILVIGYFTNWFGMKKPVVTTGTQTTPTTGARLLANNPNVNLDYLCPSGYHLVMINDGTYKCVLFPS